MNQDDSGIMYKNHVYTWYLTLVNDHNDIYYNDINSIFVSMSIIVIQYSIKAYD